MTGCINSFRGKHAFLSNFYGSPLVYAGQVYPTAEHLFQAAKASTEFSREYIRTAATPAEAKHRGRQVRLRDDWEAVKLQAMAECLDLKFAPGSPLAALLLTTGDAELVEGNTWGDRFWGVCAGVGENHLGKLLMAQRERLRA